MAFADQFGFDSKAISKPPEAKKLMDLRPSLGLAAGLKRVGGRSGTLRLGRAQRKTVGEVKRGKAIISHKY